MTMAGDGAATLGRAEPSAAPAIASLVRELAREAGGQSPITEEYVRAYLASPGCGILLARRGELVVGMISYSIRAGLYHAAPSCVIEDLIVVKDARNQGIGGLLLSDVVAMAERLGCAEVSVSTETDNVGAVRFYRRHGLSDESVYLEKHFGP